jgi:hypothetical protein
MATIAANVTQALIRANATDSDIQTYAETEVINWLDNNFRTHRWDFMRAETTASLAASATSISLASDYFKMNTVKIKDSTGDYFPLEIKDRTHFDRLIDPTTEGRPYFCSVLGSSLYFYYVPDKAYTVYYSYWKTISTITNATDVPSDIGYTDQIIQRVAFIAARQYDGLEFASEYALLKKDLADYRRNATDEGNDGQAVPLDPNTHGQRPVNFY